MSKSDLNAAAKLHSVSQRTDAMDFRIVAQHDQRSYPIPWIALKRDYSVSVGLSDRTFISPHFQARNDLFNIDNRVTVAYLIRHSTTGLRSVRNPHLSFHPPMTFHVAENGRAPLFDAFADVGMILDGDGRMTWVRIVSRPIRDVAEAGPPRANTNPRVIAVPVSTVDSSVGLALDFLRTDAATPARGLVDHFENWGSVRLHIFCDVLLGQPPTLSWYHQS